MSQERLEHIISVQETSVTPSFKLPEISVDEFGGQIPPEINLTSLESIWPKPPEFEEIIGLVKEDERHLLLPQTGFDLRRQIEMWTNKIKGDAKEGRERDKTIKDLINRNHEDAVCFCLEYIYRDLALDIPVEFGTVNEEKRIVATNYGKELYINTVNKSERDGIVKSSVEKAENFLVNAPEGSMAIIVSPSGWSGMLDHDGKPITHCDSQTYVFRINEAGELEGATLRTDMNLRQNERFVEQLTNGEHSFDPDSDERERIKNVVGSAVLLKAGKNSLTIEDIVDKIQEAKGSPNAFEETQDERRNTKKTRTFEEMKQTLQERRDLSKLSEMALEILEKHKKNMLTEISDLTPESLRQMTISLGKAILDIFEEEKKTDFIGSETKTVRGTNIDPVYGQKYGMVYSYKRTSQVETENSYSNRLGALQQLGGCAGGACNISGPDSTVVFSTQIGPGTSIKVVKEGRPFAENCPNCNKQVRAVVSGETIRCLSCNSEAKKPASIKVV